MVEQGTFLVSWQEGRWRIYYGNQWYGSYPCMLSAAVSALRIARLVSGTKVVVRKANDSQEMIWDGRQSMTTPSTQIPEETEQEILRRAVQALDR
jgi:hypothetical protein